MNAQNTIRHFLPSLSDRHRVPPIPATGGWYSLGMTDPLRVVASGLNAVERLHGAAEDIVSVPDVWAQLTVFHGALMEDTHPLHGRVAAEWRGLLACFALAAYRAQGLTSEVVHLSELRPGTWADIVRRLPPLCPLLGGGRIEEVALVRVGGQPIALAQALTLVAPARSLAVSGPIPWMRDGRFLDPIAERLLGREERLVLARFLERLAVDLDSKAGDSRDRSVLLGLARSFLRDAAPTVSGAPLEMVPLPLQLGLPAAPIFDAFRCRERAQATGSAPSDCLLRLRLGMGASPLGVVLFDPRLDQLLGRAATEIRVWRHVSLQMVRENPSLLAQVRSEAQADGHLLVEAKDLFLERLYRTDGVDGERGFAEHPLELRNHLLPFSPFVLALLDPAGLAHATHLGAGSGTTVDLMLQLKEGATVTLSRHYAQEESLEPPATLASWPDLSTPSWRLHLAYSSATPEFQFTVASLISQGGIVKALSASDKFSMVAAARGMLQGRVDNLCETRWFRNDRQGSRAFHTLPGPAEAAVLLDCKRQPASAAGLLLLPEPTAGPPAIGATGAVLGLDFGTTNTSAYLSFPGQEPRPLRILARYLTAYSDSPQARDELDRELLPTNAIDVPFQTILRIRQPAPGTVGPEGLPERLPFRDALIYFAQQREKAFEYSNGSDLAANLKWSDDLGAREQVKLFLAQVIILALAEATAEGVDARSMEFRFSYPEAFRPWQLTGFSSAATEATRLALSQVTGGVASARKVDFQTESVATAQYFIHSLNAPATEGLVTFDIGGQTTDVTVIQGQSPGSLDLAWRGSFELAGRHMLIDHLRQYPALLTTLAHGRPELQRLVVALSRASHPGRDKGLLGTELVVNSPAFALAIEQGLSTLAGIVEYERLRAVALTGLAGLLDYVGRVVRHLTEVGKIMPRAATSVSVCLGGRTSLLFRALLDGDEAEQAKLLAFLTAAAGDALPRARLLFSDHPKEEVAYGLVRDDRTLVGQVPSEPLLGEAVTSAARSAAASDLVSDLDLAAAWRIDEPKEFLRFVAKLQELRIRPVLPDQVLGTLVGEANAEMQRALAEFMRHRSDDVALTGGNSSAVGPPFVVLLRRFVRRLAIDANAVRFNL